MESICNFYSRNISNIQFIRPVKQFLIANFLLFLVFSTTSVIAQPSGGPYGPIKQKYDLPKVSGKIYFVAPDGKADAPGESIAASTTLEAAFKKVKSGDAIILRGGTYRTVDLILNQGITIQPY